MFVLLQKKKVQLVVILWKHFNPKTISGVQVIYNVQSLSLQFHNIQTFLFH